MQPANKVALNTVILYTKMILTVGIALYSTRLVLKALGEVDFGIYNLIAGIITMLAFLNAAMSTSTQRFLSYHQGQNSQNAQKNIFSNSLLLHLIVAIIVVLILEIVGLFLFDGFLNIPANKIEQARFVYHSMGIAVFFTILSVPFTASLNAHENMLWIAIVNIIEVLLKLGIALTLFLLADEEKLLFYALAMALINLISLLFYGIYCLKKYEECSLGIRKHLNKGTMKELSSFAGWNLFGALCGMGKTQGLAVVFNLFFGPIINSAYAIANQVSGQMNFASATMLRAMNPQIMKSEGVANRERVLRLSTIASKLGFFLLAFIALPCIFEMPHILRLWLGEFPKHTALFCSMVLIATMVDQLTIGLSSAVQAVGRLKTYMLVVGVIKLAILPLGYILLLKGADIVIVMIGYIVCEFFAGIARLLILKYQMGLSIHMFTQNVLARVVVPVITTSGYMFFIRSTFQHEYSFLFTIISGSIIFIISAYIFGMHKNEKNLINNIVFTFCSKINSKIKR